MFWDNKNDVSGKMWCSGEINQSSGKEFCQNRSMLALKTNLRAFPPHKRIFQPEIYIKTKLLSSNMGRLFLWRSALVLLDAPNKTCFVLNFLVLCFGVFLHAAMAELKLKPNLRLKRWLGWVAVYILWIGITCLVEGAHAGGCDRKGIKVGKMLQESFTRLQQALQ